MASDKTATQIAHGCEPCLDCRARKRCRVNRLLGNIKIELLQSPLVVITGEIGRQMSMCIHETRRKRRVAKVDYLRVAWNRQTVSCVDNLIALHDNDAVLYERVRFS